MRYQDAQVARRINSHGANRTIRTRVKAILIMIMRYIILSYISYIYIYIYHLYYILYNSVGHQISTRHATKVSKIKIYYHRELSLRRIKRDDAGNSVRERETIEKNLIKSGRLW